MEQVMYRYSSHTLTQVCNCNVFSLFRIISAYRIKISFVYMQYEDMLHIGMVV